jgi:UDP-N-acetylglucosamine:LPS N-acetylglucosamine transferase
LGEFPHPRPLRFERFGVDMSSMVTTVSPVLAPDAPPVDHPTERRRVLFVSSSGGHLAQLLQLRSWWIHHERRWVTFDLPDARSKLEGETLIPAYFPTTRSIVNLVRNTPLARRVLEDFGPDVVISNGAGVAIPFFAMARLMGIPTVYLEVYDRIDSQTLTGRLVQPLTTRFCVQWPEQQDLYPGSVLTGPLY